MTPKHSATRPPQLPAGAGGILPTIWATFVVTVLLALIFSFGNVWDLGRKLGVERHVAPLIGPAVDFTAIGLLIVVPWLVLAGMDPERLRPATRLMRLAGALTLTLNSAPAAIKGWTHDDPTAWGRAAVEAIVPLLLIAWSHVGPLLVGLFMEARTAHLESVADVLQKAARAAAERDEESAAQIASAVAAARKEEAATAQVLLDESAAQRAELESSLRAAEERHRAHEEILAAALRRAEEKAATARAKPSSAPKKTPVRRPRRTVEEWVAAAKDALPEWQLETPTGSVIGSALDLGSDGTISKIRQRLEADRLALTPDGEQS